MTYITGYIAAFMAFIMIDAVWLLVIARKFYRQEIGHLFRDDVQLIPVILFYTCYVGILLYLVIIPQVATGNITRLLLSSALFGLAAYGTYDITNYALLKNWSLTVTIVDIFWGMTITTISSAIGYFAIRSLA